MLSGQENKGMRVDRMLKGHRGWTENYEGNMRKGTEGPTTKSKGCGLRTLNRRGNSLA